MGTFDDKPAGQQFEQLDSDRLMDIYNARDLSTYSEEDLARIGQILAERGMFETEQDFHLRYSEKPEIAGWLILFEIVAKLLAMSCLSIDRQ